VAFILIEGNRFISHLVVEVGVLGGREFSDCGFLGARLFVKSV
jgi:hypothetical protein